MDVQICFMAGEERMMIYIGGKHYTLYFKEDQKMRLTNGLSHPYHLDESNFILGV